MNKNVRSPNYNYTFRYEDGYFARWGKTLADDPDMSPFGPEIADVEISTKCSRGCKFCYKGNTCEGKNMSFETFKIIFDKLPKNLTQIAFGLGDLNANPDIWKIFEYCRDNKVVPNVTIHGSGMTPELYDKLAFYCGAVAVSLYDYDVCYNAVQELSKREMKQINIHALLSEESYDKCLKVLKDKLTDERLKGLNAIVYLSLKQKGRGVTFHMMNDKQKFNDLISFALDNKIAFGFDSCTAPKVMQVAKDKGLKQIEQNIEPCESSLFSIYIDVNGKALPCSFSEGLNEGIDVTKCKDFMAEVWNGKPIVDFRNRLLANKDCNGCRNCPLYNLNGG